MRDHSGTAREHEIYRISKTWKGAKRDLSAKYSSGLWIVLTGGKSVYRRNRKYSANRSRKYATLVSFAVVIQRYCLFDFIESYQWADGVVGREHEGPNSVGTIVFLVIYYMSEKQESIVKSGTYWEGP